MTISNGFIGFEEQGYLYLLKDPIYEKLLSFEARMQRRFPYDMTKCCKSMDELNAIERFSNGKTKTFNLRVETSLGKQTFIKLRTFEMRRIIESNIF